MKNIPFLLLAIVAVIFVSSCSSDGKKKIAETETSDAGVTDMHTSANSLSYFGRYEGVLPTASTEGMKLVLQLNNDSTFTLHIEYVGKEDAKFDESGVFTIENDIISLPLSDEQYQYYKVEEGRVVFLDQEKNRITGSHADMYILHQVATIE